MGELIEQCSECVSLLGDYLDGSLPRERADALEMHLSRCMPCITFVRTYKTTCRVARTALERNIPEEVCARLHDFLNKSLPKQKP